MALPHLAPPERDAAFSRIRKLEAAVPAYQLRSFGASVLEIFSDSLTDPVLKKAAYAEALNLAAWYASGASSGGEGTARSLHVRDLEAKLRILEVTSHPTSPAAMQSSIEPLAPPPVVRSSATSSLPPLLPPRPAGRPGFLTAVGWILIVTGAMGTPVSFISTMMILAGGDGSAGGSLFGGLIVIGGPPATLIAGIGLLRRRHWAYAYALAVLSVFAVYSLVQILRGSTPERSTVSPSGVITTVLASSPIYPLHVLIIALSVFLLVRLRSAAIRAEFSR